MDYIEKYSPRASCIGQKSKTGKPSNKLKKYKRKRGLEVTDNAHRFNEMRLPISKIGVLGASV